MNTFDQAREQDKIDPILYIRILRKRRPTLLKFVTTIIFITIAGQGLYYVYQQYIKKTPAPGIYAIITAGKIDDKLISEPGKKLDAINNPLQHETLLAQLKAKNKNLENLKQFPIGSFYAISNNPESTILVSNIKDKSKDNVLNKTLVETMANYLTTDDQAIFNKQLKILGNSLVNIQEKNTLIEQRFKEYQTDLDEIKKNIGRLSDQSDANALALTGYLPSRDIITQKITELKNTLLSNQQDLVRLNAVKTAATPTRIDYGEIPSTEDFSLKPFLLFCMIFLLIILPVSLFLGGFWLFLLEWWENNEQRL